MTTKKNGWTITGSIDKNKSKNTGALTHDQSGFTIGFGNKFIKKECKTNRIDLTKMEHGTNESPGTTINCFIAAADLIHEERNSNRSVTIHCHNGRSRTAFSLIVYLMRHDSFTYDDAAKFISDGQNNEREVEFEIVKKGLHNQYNDWIKDSEKEIIDKKNKALIRATNVSFAQKCKHKVYYDVLPNKAQTENQTSELNTLKRKVEALDSTSTEPTAVRRKADQQCVDEGIAYLERHGIKESAKWWLK